MTGKGLTWTSAHLREAVSPEDVRAAIVEARAQLGDGSLPAPAVLTALEEVALDAARARAELRNATRLREVLLAGVAHDLRNPLNTFAMSAGLLRDDLEGPDFDRDRALSLLSRMDRACSRMQGLIDDLVEASRVEAGGIEYTRHAEDPAAIVRAAIAKARGSLDKTSTIEEGSIVEGASIDVDRSRMTEALLKLVAVALRMAGEGTLVRLGVERLDNSVLFTVRATIHRAVANAAAYDDNRGGLSLLIARGLITAQGGQLSSELTPEGPRTVASFPARG
jgi:signal transduction histidine kinase